MRTIARRGFKDWLVKTGDGFNYDPVKVEIDFKNIQKYQKKR
jgi:hypothetical protein